MIVGLPPLTCFLIFYIYVHFILLYFIIRFIIQFIISDIWFYGDLFNEII